MENLNELMIRACIAERRQFCDVRSKPRASVEYARGSESWRESEARIDASIQAYYNECRARPGVTWVGD